MWGVHPLYSRRAVVITRCIAARVSILVPAQVQVTADWHGNQTLTVTGEVEGKSELLAEPFSSQAVEKEVDGGVDNNAEFGHRESLVHDLHVGLEIQI